MIVLRRTPFKRQAPPPSLARVRQWEGKHPSPRATPRAVSVRPATVSPLPKEGALQHAGYMAAVRRLPCARCGTLAVPRQFCHADSGKGLAIKTDCRRGWPGCAPCHYFVGSTGKLTKAGRREFEETAAHNTRLILTVTGQWPARLPRWSEA